MDYAIIIQRGITAPNINGKAAPRSATSATSATRGSSISTGATADGSALGNGNGGIGYAEFDVNARAVAAIPTVKSASAGIAAIAAGSARDGAPSDIYCRIVGGDIDPGTRVCRLSAARIAVGSTRGCRPGNCSGTCEWGIAGADCHRGIHIRLRPSCRRYPSTQRQNGNTRQKATLKNTHVSIPLINC